MLLRIYIFSNLPGGESFWFERISKKLGCEIITFWDHRTTRRLVSDSGISNFIVNLFLEPVHKINPKLAMGIYGLLGTYTYKIRGDNYINIVSSAFIPIPRGKNVVAYIHTPSRLLTINYESEMNKRKNRFASMIFLRIWRFVYFSLYGRSLTRARVILVNSKNVQKRLLDYFGVQSKVLYPSTDLENFRNEAFEDYFFFPSRISSDKNQLFALKAFKLFCQHNKGFRLILASTPLFSKENLAYFEEIKDYINSNGIPVEIKIGLSRKNLIDLYSRAYACLFSGIEEDFGHIPLESMASGKPIIALGSGGVKETIIDGVTGYLVNTEEEMANRMIQLVSDTELNTNMGKKGREHVEKSFSDDVFLKNLINELNITYQSNGANL